MKHDRLLVGTYHKTGTVWMNRVFHALADALSLPYFGPHLAHAMEEEKGPARPGIYNDHHAQFPAEFLAADHAGFRMVRDPRDIIISGAHYHEHAPEPWLDRPLERLGGKAYRELLLECAPGHDRYVFEMRDVAHRTTRKMINDFTTLPTFLVVKYEDWVDDPSMRHFSTTMAQLGLDPAEIETAEKIFYRVSLFGDFKGDDGHSRSGKVAQWRRVYTRPLAEQFIELMGDALIKLGYEDNHDWALSLPAGDG